MFVARSVGAVGITADVHKDLGVFALYLPTDGGTERVKMVVIPSAVGPHRNLEVNGVTAATIGLVVARYFQIVIGLYM